MMLDLLGMVSRAWQRLSSQTSRMPVPWVLVCALVNALLAHDCRVGALLMLLTLVRYLWPPDAAMLQVQGLIPTVIRPQHVSWSLLLHPVERGACSKT